jgi:type I restriction enzyme, S subunit
LAEGSIVRELPKGWAETNLDKIAEIIMGQSPPGSSYNQTGEGFPLINGPVEFGPSPFSETVKSKFTIAPTKFCQKGDLIVCVRGSTTGRMNISGFEACIGRGVAAIRSHADQNYINLIIHSKQEEIYRLGTGSTFPNVSSDILGKIPIPLPPLNEQKRIADRLDLLLTRIDKTKAHLDRIPPLLKRFRQSVLAAATSGKLTEDWREANDLDIGIVADEIAALIEQRKAAHPKGKKFKDPVEPDLTYWNTDLPDTWELLSISSFSECLDHVRIPVKRDDRNSQKGLYPYYGANGLVDHVDEYLFDDEIVLVTEDETFFGREKPIAYRSSGKCWVNNHAHVLRPEDGFSADYLCYCLMYYNVIPWLTGTTGRAKLTQGVLNAIPIGVPPKAEIIEIVRRVETLFAKADRIEAQYKSARQNVDRLTPALLAKAFRGELVPQDPNDKPASVLLERVKAAKATQAPAKTKRAKKS